MVDAGLIAQAEIPKGGRSKRVRIVYSITKDGQEKFDELTESVSPQSWDDDNFEVHVAFFSPTSTRSRLRILEGRHRRLKEKAPTSKGLPLALINTLWNGVATPLKPQSERSLGSKK